MKTINIFLAIVIVFLLLFSTSHADGNKLLEQCLAAEHFLDTNIVQDEFSVGTCIGMVQGVRNTMQFMQDESSIKACFPKNGIRNDQAIRIVTSYLKNNPSTLHEHEVVLIMLAYIDAYPCS